MTLDLGVGPFKKRVIGPGSPKDEKKVESIKEQVMDLGNVDTKELPIVVLSGGVKAVGETSKIVREGFEALDLFVGRYLTLIVTEYIGFKFLHFKVFPDFPPFG